MSRRHGCMFPASPAAALPCVGHFNMKKIDMRMRMHEPHLQPMPLGHVLVLPVEALNLAVLVEGVVDGVAALDVQLQVHEGVGAHALVLHIDAGHVVLGAALKQLVDRAIHYRPLPCMAS